MLLLIEIQRLVGIDSVDAWWRDVYDFYVVVLLNGRFVGRTSTKWNCMRPQWNETIAVDTSQLKHNGKNVICLRVMDANKVLSDKYLFEVQHNYDDFESNTIKEKQKVDSPHLFAVIHTALLSSVLRSKIRSIEAKHDIYKQTSQKQESKNKKEILQLRETHAKTIIFIRKNQENDMQKQLKDLKDHYEHESKLQVREFKSKISDLKIKHQEESDVKTQVHAVSLRERTDHMQRRFQDAVHQLLSIDLVKNIV